MDSGFIIYSFLMAKNIMFIQKEKGLLTFVSFISKIQTASAMMF